MGNGIALSPVVPPDAERQANEKIGEAVWNIMIGHVKNGNIDSQKMKDFARALGPEIGGNHERRMENRPCDDRELRRILADWWTLPETSCTRGTLHDLSTDEALEILSSIFSNSDISLNPLAKSINKIRASLKEVVLRMCLFFIRMYVAMPLTDI